MEIGLGLGFRVFIVTFRAGFDGLFFILLVLTVAEAIVDFDRSGSMLISSRNLTGHHDAMGKKNKKGCQPVLKFTMCYMIGTTLNYWYPVEQAQFAWLCGNTVFGHGTVFPRAVSPNYGPFPSTPEFVWVRTSRIQSVNELGFAPHGNTVP